MVKQAPGPGRIAIMIAFALSVAGILLWLWISFGGAIPLKPEGYRLKVPFPEASLLVSEADVRISGINVGKVKEEELALRPPRTIATIELDERYAPVPSDTRAILRQKTILGETYVELTPADAKGPHLDDGATLPPAQVERTTELDELYQVFDGRTKRRFAQWVDALGKSVEDGGDELNYALGNLPAFTRSGTDLLRILDRRRDALGTFVRNTGLVFSALNEDYGTLRDLIVNSNRVFETTARNDESLAETIEVFPTFLDESRVTLDRLARFSRDTGPLVRELRPVARDLAPTLRDLRRLAPDLTNLFRDLRVLNRVAPRTLPDATRFIRGAAPVLEAAHGFLPQLNPVLSFLRFQSPQVADFITVGGAALAGTLPPTGDGVPRHNLRQIGSIGPRSLALNSTRPDYERGNAYLEPNAWKRFRPLGVLESFDCSNTGQGPKRDPSDGSPPCFVKPPTLWGDGGLFPTVESGEAPRRTPPEGNEGAQPPGAPAAPRLP